VGQNGFAALGSVDIPNVGRNKLRSGVAGIVDARNATLMRAYIGLSIFWIPAFAGMTK
jgi:hypothetical protein